jgi:hypothetical protein
VRGLWGNRFQMIDYRNTSASPTVSISTNGTTVTGSLDLYRAGTRTAS